ncbi:hypothetical protein R1flu_023185 [Riccia fluitans]|uniref:DDE Tnp4 domain-containing protein n=1 Tax=Riccia fluitans TaxID=41844 RepID=A0ABD1XS24_9MARC
MGNYLLMCADLYRMSKGAASIAVREMCAAIVDVFGPLVIPPYTLERAKKNSVEFEALWEIPYIIGAVDGSHIPVIASAMDAEAYYNRKGFHSVILQGIVDVRCLFLDFHFGWAGALHDYAIFKNSREGQHLIAGLTLQTLQIN